MKHLSLLTTLLLFCLFSLVATTTSCTMEQVVTPETTEIEAKINPRTDFSGLEDKVKVKVAERYHISISELLTCYYDGITPEGYGRYRYTTATYPGIYIVTVFIGEE